MRMDLFTHVGSNLRRDCRLGGQSVGIQWLKRRPPKFGANKHHGGGSMRSWWLVSDVNVPSSPKICLANI